MTKRKPNNMRKRIANASEALLRYHGVCVVNIDPSGKQGLMSWKSMKNVRPSQAMANAICDYAREWAIVFCAMCQDQKGERYMKMAEAFPKGRYLAADLEGVIEDGYRELCNECNPAHLKASGWIALPVGHSLFADDAYRIMEAAGVWSEENLNGDHEPGPLAIRNPAHVPMPCTP